MKVRLQTIATSIPKATHATLHEIAEERGVRISDVVSKACQDVADRYRASKPKVEEDPKAYGENYPWIELGADE